MYLVDLVLKGPLHLIALLGGPNGTDFLYEKHQSVLDQYKIHFIKYNIAAQRMDGI